MSRKVYVTVKVNVIMTVDEGTEIADVINEMDYDFTPSTENATIEDTELVDFEVTDSK
jgi:hypothetical protein